MILSRVTNIQEITSILVGVTNQIEQLGKLNLNDTSVNSEMLFLNLLNMTYGWSLVSANESSPNAPAVDLVDKQNKIVVQVSAVCTKQKVDGALSKQATENYANDGYRLKFMFVGKQNDSIKKAAFDNRFGIGFDPCSDIFLLKDVLRSIQSLADVEKQTEILAMLRRETGDGFCLTMDTVRECLSRQIERLGARYTPELNIETDLGRCLYAFSEPDDLLDNLMAEALKLEQTANAFLQKASKNANDDVELAKGIEIVQEVLENLVLLRNAGTFEDARPFVHVIRTCSEYRIFSLPHQLQEDKDAVAKDRLEYLHRVFDEMRKFSLFCETNRLYVTEKSVLVIKGDSGAGKSHATADFLRAHVDAGGVGLLFLGNEFGKNDDVLSQLALLSGFGCERGDLLPEISRLGRSLGKVAIVAIDALNEGEGPLLWKGALPRLVQEFEKFSNIKFVLTTRTDGFEGIIPESLQSNDSVFFETCEGFLGSEEYAVKSFCEYYGLAEPAFPALDPALSNPLYLKLLCMHLKSRGTAKLGTRRSLTEISRFYLGDVNSALSAPDRLDYDEHYNLVMEIARAIVMSNEFDGYWIDYSHATRIASDVAVACCNRPGQAMRELVRENFFSVADTDNGPKAYFTYQRMGDVFYCDFQLDSFDCGSPDLKSTIADSSLVKALTSSVTSWDAVEAFAVVLPERLGLEVFEVLDMEDDDYERSSLASSFVRSLLWREKPTMSTSVGKFLNDVVLRYKGPFEEFVDVLIRLSLDNGSPYNAAMLDKILKSYDFKMRDASWTYLISVDKAPMCVKFADWLWRHPENVDGEQAGLAAILLGWFCCSTCTLLRDVSTKALATLISLHPSLAPEVWASFADVDDDYVLERVLAALFGAYCVSATDGDWRALVHDVYRFVYCGDETYPNVLVRDYASSLIKRYAADSGSDETFFPKASGSGHSFWYETLPTNGDIDALREGVIERYGDDSNEARNAWWIIHSMTTEYGRGPCAYGDFGRYVFGGWVSLWKNQFESDQVLANIVLRWIFDTRYSFDLHTKFDSRIRSMQGYLQHPAERLSKKYQWIGMRRIIARLTDRFPPYREHKEYTEGYHRLIDSAGVKISGSLRRRDFDYQLTDEEAYAREHPEDFEMGIRRELVPTSEVKYELLGMRDVDPTWLLPAGCMPAPTKKLLPFFEVPSADAKDIENWVESDEITGIDAGRIVTIDEKQYAILYCQVEACHGQRDCDQDQGESVYSIRDGKSYALWLSGSAFVKVWKSDNHKRAHARRCGNGVPGESIRPVFFMDVYESDAFKTEADFIKSENTDDDGGLVISATTAYEWSASKDASLGVDASVDAHFPCAELAKFFSLRNGHDAAWRTPDGNVVAFDTSFAGYRETAVLFDAALLEEFMQANDYELIWGEFWEKRIGKKYHKAWQSVVSDHEGNMVTTIDDSDEGVCRGF